MKTAVLLSGGVDSSVALFELLRQGRTDVEAYYLKIWLEDELQYLGDCPWEEDLSFARAVCDQAGVPLHVVPLQQQYYERVVEYAIRELRAGHTPSPDIFCNQRVKFGAFFDYVGGQVDRVASGHYGVVERLGDGSVRLRRSPDPVKDQTYFLSHLSQEQLRRIEFPIGRFWKSQVRERADEYRLANRARKDSQGICFLGKIKYNDFVRHYLGERQGVIRERETGRVLGGHSGYWFHTIGQRSGLGLGNGPWYVIEKDIDENIIWVSHRDHRPEQTRNQMTVGELTWIGDPPLSGQNLTCKLRHGPELHRCRIQMVGDRCDVELEDGDAGIAPGQFSVFYDGDVCLGAGMILSVPSRIPAAN